MSYAMDLGDHFESIHCVAAITITDPAEPDSFLGDDSRNACEKLVDRLLASPRFGERWARHWMDLVRYCESHGSQGDPELPMAWRYRDYLIRAFNGDVPYDQFVREHIAGDLLPQPRLNRAEGLNESMLGTAHLRMVEFGYVPVDALDDQVKVVDNQIDVFSKAFLGLTVSCARCHDHKFDPISQKDFYALYGVFASTRPGQVVVDTPAMLQRNRAELAVLKEEIRSGLAEAWRGAAGVLGTELQEHGARSAEQERVEAGIRRLSQEVADVESRARAELARQRGAELPVQLPVPLARWSFEGDFRDALGAMHGRAEGGAAVRGGRLLLNGTNAWVVTEPLPVNLREKTLEVWVALAGLEQQGGGALTVQTPDSEAFDSIVFGEREPAHWIAGSDFFRRTRDVGGPAETAKPGEFIHLAVVYGADNSITLYRNGTRYGTNYQHGTLQPFAAGSARVLLGKRHLASGVTALAGEIEEARLYSRALTADEVSASFRAGAISVDAATLAKSLTPAEREKLSLLRKELEQLRAAQAKQLDQPIAADAWKAALADAAKNSSNPLHPWVKLSGQTGETFHEGWRQLATYWKSELASRRDFNRTHFTRGWDLCGEDAGRWFMAGTGAAAPAGGFCLEIKGERVLRGLYPAGVFTHALTRKQNGVFTSPRFKVETDSISVRALGERSMARLVVENYAIGGGGLYPAQGLNTDEMKWFRLDTAYRKGANAYLEFVTADDSPNSGSAEEGRACFGAADIVFHNGSQSPKELLVPAAFLLTGDAPSSVTDLAGFYGRRLTAAVKHWREGSLSDEELTFLDYFVRRDLLPASLARLPQLKESFATYRRLEAEIPVPRRAPGVHEAAAFNQPLFVRGQITQPGEPVPRRFLEMFDGQAFPTTFSGRLELAGEVASSANPLTARVMVNRLWHHLFGRGLVGTVDNFGRLGEKPTHPELLDYLTARFIEHGWSMKETIRFLVTSKTFQQSALASANARRLDPGNELLSHARVRRLEAEAIRDAVLAVSGQLDLMVALSGLVAGQKAVAAAVGPAASSPFAPRLPHFPPKVKSVIFCFMSGGVSHVDTFDPKPRLKRDHGKPMPVPVRPTMFNQNGNIMASPWAFRNQGQSGLPVSDLFPHIGACADDLAVIRSMTSVANEHAQGNFFMHTGFSLAGFPSAGAWTTYGLGSVNQNLPGFVVLASGGVPLGGVNIYGNGFLPAVHQASLLDPTQKEPLANITPRESDRLQRKRLGFIERLDRGHLARLQGDEQVESAIQNCEIAYRMQSAVPELVDLRGESEATRKLYGLDSPVREKAEYARQCLLARRLVERGVRFIELTCLPRPADLGQTGNPWDQHGVLKAGHSEMAFQVDQPIAGLIKDLKARGLFDETLIVWAGEFGRTPFAQSTDGRDHNPFGFSVWLAGGGIKGGTAHGATDELGYHAVQDVCTVYDLWATVQHLLGLDHEKLTCRFGGRDFRLTDVHGEVVKAILA